MRDRETAAGWAIGLSGPARRRRPEPQMEARGPIQLDAIRRARHRRLSGGGASIGMRERPQMGLLRNRSQAQKTR